MKFLAIILALILVVYQVDASEEEEGGDINIVIEQHVELPGSPDVDECFEDIHTCGDNEVCRNTPGSYRCVCADGFEKVDGICEDINECIEKENLCGDFGECVNDPGSFHCDCDAGYQEDEIFCKDINECIENENLCGDFGECVNDPGSFHCDCDAGYQEEEGFCKDVNECLDDAAFQCEENEDCFNTEGSYDCQCQDEYYREGNTCQPCSSPSLFLEDLGCIFYISDQKRSWADWKTKCQAEGKRLLEGIKYKHLEPLRDHFSPLMSSQSPWVWIGMKDSRWITSGEEVTDEDLWRPGQPTGGNDDGCGEIMLSPSAAGLQDNTCDFAEFALCQSLPLD